MVPPTTVVCVGYYYRTLLKVKRLYEAFNLFPVFLIFGNTYVSDLWTLLMYVLQYLSTVGALRVYMY